MFSMINYRYKMASFRIKKYLLKKAKLELLETQSEQKLFSAVVVIPVLAEENLLPRTIASLQQVDGDFATILVINNRVNSSMEQKADNQRVLLKLRAEELNLSNLFWIDLASVGNEIPDKFGVGLVRRIGMDTALTLLDEDGIICSLDADTLVEPDYITTALATLKRPIGAGYFEFNHQRAESSQSQKAIDAYEEYLHHYVDGLKLAKSPYAYHSIGSTMVVTAEAYVLADGIPVKRLAGEDFYFLQNIAKHCEIVEVPSRVYPSARLSERTPFGTGQRMLEYEQGRSGEHLFSKDAFSTLGYFLQLVDKNIDSESCEFTKDITSDFVHFYLDQIGFESVWKKNWLNYKQRENCLKAFHRWFDGLKTLQFIKGVDDEI